jgi:NAD(P)-dependent dehydrogenase (short-subunit alcohol dehydrogenase family)
VADQYTQQDPTTQYPQPNFGEQKLEPPGLEPEMDPKPDYGYDTYRGSGRLEGKKAVITGGDSGIGRAVALAFAREGADVLISYLEEEEPDAQETARVVEEAGRKAVRVPGDVRDEAHCQDIVQKAVEEFGRIDVLINNAAYQMVQPGGIADITTEQFDRVLKTNLYAMFWLSKAAIPHMRPGASIINTTSIEAYQPEPGLLDYASTKGAIVTFTKGLAQGPDSPGHQGQRGGAGAGVDAADPGHHARRAGLAVRRLGVPHRAPGPAGRAGAALRLPRLPGVELRQRPGSGRDRRRTAS